MLGFRLNKLGASLRNNRPLVALRFDDPTRSLDSRITFSRASNATYFDSTGTLQTAGNNVARSNAFQDYNPSTLAPLGFLIEEQRTNLILQSNDTTSASWTKTNITATSITAERGFPGTSRITAVTGATLKALNPATALSITAGSVYTCRAIVRYESSARYLSFTFDDTTTTNGVWTNFDLLNGTVATAATAYGTGASASSSITSLGSNYYMLTLTGTAGTVATNARWALSIQPNGTSQFANNNTTNTFVFLHGQCELGAFATSVIATTTAAATRLADSASITGTNFSQWFNATEGTFAIVGDYSYIAPLTPGLLKVADSGSDNNRMFLAISAGTQRLTVITAGVEVVDISRSGVAAGTVFKQAAAYKANDFASCINAGTVGTDAIGAVPTGLVALYLSRDNTFNYPNGHIQRLSYYRTRLANETLQSLTA